MYLLVSRWVHQCQSQGRTQPLSLFSPAHPSPTLFFDTPPSRHIGPIHSHFVASPSPSITFPLPELAGGPVDDRTSSRQRRRALRPRSLLDLPLDCSCPPSPQPVQKGPGSLCSLCDAPFRTARACLLAPSSPSTARLPSRNPRPNWRSPSVPFQDKRGPTFFSSASDDDHTMLLGYFR